MEYIHDDLIQVAAAEPLILGKFTAHFEPKSFFKRALQISEARGHG
jgi:hypothetical protein